MTGSVGEIRSALHAVLELLASAGQYAGTAGVRLDEALGVLSRLGDQHSEPLPPPELRRAVEHLQVTLGLIGSGAELVGDIGARL